MLTSHIIRVAVEAALAEDAPYGDITCETTIPADETGSAHLTARENGVMSGIDVFAAAFAAQNPAVTVTAATDMGRACGRLQDMLRDGTLTHLPEDGQQPLWQAAAKATTRPIGKNGLFGWNRPDDDTDISPLNAVTLALHGAMTTRRDPTAQQEAWY